MLKPRKATYVAHRWLALIVAVQLLAWSVGGFVFSVLDIRDVRGETDIAEQAPRVIDPGDVDVDVSAALRIAGDAGVDVGRVESVLLRDRGLGLRYELAGADDETVAAIDARTGEVTTLITPDDAVSVALHDFAGGPGAAGVELLRTNDHYEYRGKPLPAYRVRLDNARRTRIYVHAVSGRVTARRNRTWRVFDFFWMLHIMDYGQRDDFNHPLLTGFSVLAVLTSASGIALWVWRVKPTRRRRARPAPGG